jgi:hypothetical protein
MGQVEELLGIMNRERVDGGRDENGTAIFRI